MVKILSYIVGIVILSGSCMIANIAHAEMYKWVDENGNTHYTQNPPPPNIVPDIIAPPPSINSEAATKKEMSTIEKANKLREERIKKAEDTAKEKSELAQKKAQCEKAKKVQASYERPRVNYVDDDGNRRRATEEERQADLAKAKDEVKKLCHNL